ncbi:MAG: murein biosynthesis integral membrane protein MurJ [Chitinispirillaceae bacterium]
MAVSNLLSRVLGFVRVQALATIGGTSAAVDAYSFSFTIPDVINHFLAGSALSITFIPIFQSYLVKKRPEKAWYVFSNILTIGTILFVVLIALSILFTDDFLRLAAGKNIVSDPEKFALTVQLTRIILPAQLFFFWGALLNGVQYAHKRFLFPALTPLLYNACIIGGGVFLHSYLGIAGFSWGVLVGAFIGNVAIQIPGALRVGLRFRPAINLTDKDFIRYTLITLPFMLGISMTFSNELLFRIFGSMIPQGDGALASLDYSYKIMFLLVGIFGQAFAAGFYPFLSQLVVEKRFREVVNLLNRMLTQAGGLLIPLSGIMIVTAVDIVTVLLQWGKFDEASTLATARPLSMYLLGAYFCTGVLIINRVFYALQNTVLPLIISTAAVVLSLPVFYILSQQMGAPGVALASSLSMFLQFGAMYLIWYRRFPESKQVRTPILKIAVTYAVTGAGMGLSFLIRDLLLPPAQIIASVHIRHFTVAAGATIPSLALTYTILQLSGVMDVKSIIQRIQRKLFSGGLKK